MACLKAPVVFRGEQQQAGPIGAGFKTREPLCDMARAEAPMRKVSAPRSGVEVHSSVKSSDSVCKGLKNKKEGRFDQLWMVKWYDWYSYVKALVKKVWDTSSGMCEKLLSATTRAESAKTAHAG